ncbi:MAG: glucosaminidase domain-containing protein [Terracidiphilus sp.]|nr:glucosaminidase domain-containing protein [Terracidiphilus sp.]
MNKLQNEFFQMAVPAALESQRATGVPASITLAQAILESGWGQTGLAKKAFNFFGIKTAHHVAPDSYIELPTHEVINGHTVVQMADFARYASAQDSFKAHALLLAQASRYAPAMAVRTSPAKFAAAIQKCGYSTNPNYAQGLMRLVTEFDLTQYDQLPSDMDPSLGTTRNAPPASPAAKEQAA